MANKNQLLKNLEACFKDADPCWNFMKEIVKRIVDKYVHLLTNPGASGFIVPVSIEEEMEYWNDPFGNFKKLEKVLLEIKLEFKSLTFGDKSILGASEACVQLDFKR